MKIPELLAPAGNLEKLQTAMLYGADAVYLGVERFSLRSHAGNIASADLGRACDIVHAAGGRVYLTLNAFLRPGEEDACRSLLADLRGMPVDAYIIADPGMFSLVRDLDPEREVHLSTQANTCSAPAAQFWHSLGVKRLNLARELTLEEIQAVRAGTDAELEVFVHGAMCVAYSGRCLLSAALAGRSGNQGECAQSCRWEYSVQEALRPGEYHPIEEDDRGTYLFNSHDLCLIEYLPELIRAGVDSLKIEGRMKSCYYVAAVTRVYRAALDAYRENPAGYRFDPAWRAELEKVSHRPYGPGFLLGSEAARIHPGDSGYRRSTDFVGVVLDDGSELGWLVEGRNRFECGEQLEIIGPGMRQARFEVPVARTRDDLAVTVIQPNGLVYMSLPAGTRAGDLLRREHA